MRLDLQDSSNHDCSRGADAVLQANLAAILVILILGTDIPRHSTGPLRLKGEGIIVKRKQCLRFLYISWPLTDTDL
jgi:hypothetical protein